MYRWSHHFIKSFLKSTFHLNIQGVSFKGYTANEVVTIFEKITDDENELRIRLKLCPTYDFKQEILSYGERVTVISPESFRNEVSGEYKRILKKYKD